MIARIALSFPPEGDKLGPERRRLEKIEGEREKEEKGVE
jgi:hypothetical protein